MADSTITIIVKSTAGGEKFQVVASTDDTIAELKTKVRGSSHALRNPTLRAASPDAICAVGGREVQHRRFRAATHLQGPGAEGRTRHQ